MSKAAQKAADKERRILSAALQLFSSQGYQATAVPQVARLAGVATGTIYHYFENKEALVNAVYRNSKSMLKHYLSEDNYQDDARKIFHRFWTNLTRFAEEWPEDFHFVELQDHTPYLDAESLQLEQEVLYPLSQFIIEGRRQGLFKPLPEYALMAMVWGTFVGLVKASRLGYLRINPKLMQEAEEVCWHILLK